MDATPVIRRATPRDVAGLRDIARASKGHWGYDSFKVAEWAAGIDLSPSRLEESLLYVAEAEERLVAWMALRAPAGKVCVLDDLWVDPASIGRGIGSALFRFAAELARDLGAVVIELEADPNAVLFYEKMGARPVGQATSEWGRTLPVMSLDLVGPSPANDEEPSSISPLGGLPEHWRSPAWPCCLIGRLAS